MICMACSKIKVASTEVAVQKCSSEKLFLKISQNSQESTCGVSLWILQNFIEHVRWLLLRVIIFCHLYICIIVGMLLTVSNILMQSTCFHDIRTQIFYLWQLRQKKIFFLVWTTYSSLNLDYIVGSVMEQFCPKI